MPYQVCYFGVWVILSVKKALLMSLFYINFFLKLNIFSIFSTFSTSVLTLIYSPKLYSACGFFSFTYVLGLLNPIKVLLAGYIIFLGLLTSISYFMFSNNLSKIMKFLNTLFSVVYNLNSKNYLLTLAMRVSNFFKSFF